MTKEDFCKIYNEYFQERNPDLKYMSVHLIGNSLYNFCEHLLKINDNWIEFDASKPETRPTKYGKYFVHRKDGKVHWETWNGSGWAYNGNVITHYQKINPPVKSES